MAMACGTGMCMLIKPDTCRGRQRASQFAKCNSTSTWPSRPAPARSAYVTGAPAFHLCPDGFAAITPVSPGRTCVTPHPPGRDLAGGGQRRPVWARRSGKPCRDEKFGVNGRCLRSAEPSKRLWLNEAQLSIHTTPFIRLEATRLDDVSTRLAFVEARLALLERQFDRLVVAPQTDTGKPRQPIILSCNDEGLMIVHSYAAEEDKDGNTFSWVGNDGPIHFILPVRPAHALTCTLHLQPHPKVNLGSLSVHVNDEARTAVVKQRPPERVDVSFSVPPIGAAWLSIALLGVDSVRPSDLGENADARLLMARFYGATVTFD